jgi:hypothetical protein
MPALVHPIGRESPHRQSEFHLALPGLEQVILAGLDLKSACGELTCDRVHTRPAGPA